MCAIIDANVVAEVFGTSRTGAGERFYNWLSDGSGVLVAGGKLRGELLQSQPFKKWAIEALRAGRLRYEDNAKVDKRINEIERTGAHSSDDPHVLALAQVSGARLLYTNDRKLQGDFKNKALIDRPPGKVYSTLRTQKLTKGHERLLSNRALCRSEQ